MALFDSCFSSEHYSHAHKCQGCWETQLIMQKGFPHSSLQCVGESANSGGHWVTSALRYAQVHQEFIVRLGGGGACL